MLTFSHFSIDVAQYAWFKKRRWTPLLQDINLTLNPGELVALVGGSGEGKSLLLQSVLGLLPHNMRTRGTLSYQGEQLDSRAQQALRGKVCCYLPQGVSAFNPLIRVGLQLQRAASLSGAEIDRRTIADKLRQYHLADNVINAYPSALSGGMAKRVLACNAAFSHAQIILADELTSWLDDEHAHQLLHQFQTLCSEGKSVLWVTHDLSLAARHADRIAMLHQGTIAEITSPQALEQQQVGPWLKQLWQALPEQRFIDYPQGEAHGRV